MTGSSFAQQWPGWEARGPQHHHHHHHRHGGGRSGKREFARDMAWAFARAKGSGRGRPSPEEIEQLIAMRRHRGGPFSGPGPFGSRGRGRRGRRRRGDVRLAVLRLLADQPANGYQLMQIIEERSAGAWRPSPGSMYPTLAQLEDEGLIRSAESEGSRLFEITETGREHLQTRADEPDPWESDDEDDEVAARDLKSAIAAIAAAAWQVAQAGDPRQRAQATALLAETRRSLYRILAEDAPDDADGGDDESAGDDADTV